MEECKILVGQADCWQEERMKGSPGKENDMMKVSGHSCQYLHSSELLWLQLTGNPT